MPYPIRTLAVIVLHSSLFLVLSMISTSLIFNSWLRLFMKFSRGLPLLLSPSIFPVTTMFSSPCLLMICPRKLICPALIMFINFLSVLPLLNTSSFVTWSFQDMCSILLSTEYATIELTDRIISNMDRNEIPFSIFLDLSKAFDTLDHTILLQKLKYYGIDG